MTMARKMHRPPDPEQQRRNRKRLIIGSILGVVALLLIGALTYYLRLTGGPALPRDVRERIRAEQRASGGASSGGNAAASGVAATQPKEIPAGTPPMIQQVQQLQQAARQGDTSIRTLYISDADLNQELMGLVQGEEAVKEAHAYFTTGSAYFVANVEIKNHPLNLTLQLSARVESGQVRLSVASAYVGQVSAPGQLVQKIQEGLDKKGDVFSTRRTGLYVETIEMKPGVAILTGRPAAG
jgi:hypothetical protein